MTEKLSLYITDYKPIKRALFFKNFQIREDYKKLYLPEENEEVIEIAEMTDYSNNLGFEDLLMM